MRLVLVMVGLPARGKTWTAQKLARYLQWQGTRARVFNVGSYRRERLGAGQPAEFFDPGNAEGAAARRRMAVDALEDACAWLESETSPGVAVYDATNGTRARRDFVVERCDARGLPVVFLESICNDDALVDRNVRETKLLSPDYATVDTEAALADFRARIAHYERTYESLGDGEADRSWIQVVDVGRQLVINRIDGWLPSRFVPFLMNLHLHPRVIWLTRHGESEYNALGRIGADTGLTDRGQAYAARLGAFLGARIDGRAEVWTSTLKRTIQTAASLPWPSSPHRSLNEIDAGICDGWTYEQIAQKLPEEFAARKADKLRYRYPRGESYLDVVGRLNPVILELERQRNDVVIVAHQAVLRGLYAYLLGLPREAIPHLEMPLHTVIELHPRAYGCDEVRHRLAD